MNTKKWPTVKILGVKVDFPTLKQAVEWVEEQVKYNKVGQITTPNPEQVVLAQKDEEFRGLLNRAGLSICDGAGLLWVAKWVAARSPDTILVSFCESNSRSNVSAFERVQGARIDKTHKIGQASSLKTPPRWRNSPKAKGHLGGEIGGEINRLSGVDLMLALCRKAAEKHWRVMFVGGKSNTAALAAEKIKNQNAKIKMANKKLKIIGLSGSKDIKHETEEERKEVIKKINEFKPQLLFVAYGAPWQEKWLASNLPRLKVNVAMGVGGAFDYLSVKVRRAPEIVRDLGLEWLWRLVLEPWRWRRQLALLKFVWLVIRNRYFI